MGMPPLWEPSQQRANDAALTVFHSTLTAEYGADAGDLHDFSVRRPAEFWSAVWHFCAVIGDPAEVGAVLAEDPRDAVFFPGARLNFAENLLRRSGPGEAIVFVREDGVRRSLSHDQLREQVAAVAARLEQAGVGPGDRVAAWMPNTPETTVAMLATTALGAVFTSTSPDFGVAGVLDRFGQVEPKVLIAADGYVYAGRGHSRLELLPQVIDGLPSVELCVVVGEITEWPDTAAIRGAEHYRDVVSRFQGADLNFTRLPFDHPAFILYSSGTTGRPKCIVHRGGGLLLKHLSEHRLHCDIRNDDRVFYFTTCGWMMWNWLTSALASNATLLLYDGSPMAGDGTVLFDLAQDERATLFGTSAKFLDATRKAGIAPARTHDLSALRTITSTGSPLAAEGFEYVYRDIHADVHLASISGGTDICGCFILGDPTKPVYAGEIQGPALGLDVDVYDDAGRSLRSTPGQRGELVCRNPFPSMPLGFFGDDDGSKYQSAYFDRFPGIWAHGDFASWTEHGGMVIHGRSDATLNAGGVRIGTAEIYRQVDQLPEVYESLAIGQEWEDDTRIVLFVRLAEGTLTGDLQEEIRARLRTNCSPRHVPAKILAVADLPRTRSGKLAELAVADVVHGRPVRNREALANPESLDLFIDLPELTH
jgi:acetoacetyl-CoA synthetase